MGSGLWFRSIISIKRLKDDKSKQAKVRSATDKPNTSKCKDDSHEVSSSTSNGHANKNLEVPPVQVEDAAATRIQAAFRAYRARKTIIHLKGTVKFHGMIQDHTGLEQASTALSYMHSWSRIQDQIRARRLHMVMEGRIRQKKLENQLKFEAKLHELEVEWCGGSDTMEEIISRIQQKEEAAIKRERAMAYAFSHQWRANSSQYLGQASYILGKENWGWSWTERWIAARPWEVRVHPHPTDSNKVPAKLSRSYKLANQPEKKIPVSVKPTKAKNLVYPTAEK
ncbi:hypothetical protein FH972_019603 [Carpinus fangiana]|uniref:Protein IQ-DOMAIN 1 n=1 Tax=Carpinus fangiana TaxID=176857 RepID=A0A5N6RQL9_9ROSI|nr:hypothetical protein FH972_019603 [Carpinus fangiana]